MSLEQFQIIREIESLKNMTGKEQELITEQTDRLIHLDTVKKQKLSQQESKLEELLRLKNESQQIEKDLFELSRLQNQAKEHVGNLVHPDQIASYEHQLKTSQQKIATLEDLGLANLEKLELAESEIEKSKKFLNGIEDTRKEIEEEVHQFKFEKNKIISNYKLRIENLVEQLDSTFKNVVLQLNKKNFAKSSITYLKQHACSACGLSMNRVDEAEIEHLVRPHFCKGCGRLMLPLNLLG